MPKFYRFRFFLLDFVILTHPFTTPSPTINPPCFDDIKLIVPLGSRESNKRNTVTYLVFRRLHIVFKSVAMIMFSVIFSGNLSRNFKTNILIMEKFLVFNFILLVMWKTLSHTKDFDHNFDKGVTVHLLGIITMLVRQPLLFH